MELYFQGLGASDDGTRCLSVRSSGDDGEAGPGHFNAFNAKPFGADGVWRHVVFTHQRQTLRWKGILKVQLRDAMDDNVAKLMLAQAGEE